MRTELARIGNSRGIRIPKPLIAQCGFGKVVELRVTSEGIVISPYRSPRSGWKQAFAAAAARETTSYCSAKRKTCLIARNGNGEISAAG